MNIYDHLKYLCFLVDRNGARNVRYRIVASSVKKIGHELNTLELIL